MAVVIDSHLPAFEQMRANGLSVKDSAATEPDITIGLINLMPIKQDTEKDFMSILAPIEENVGVKLINMVTHRVSRNTPKEHLEKFYTDFSSVAHRLDGVIVTGAPLEDVAFEDVDYWEEITGIFDWLHCRRIPTFYVCWGAFAALWHWWRIPMTHVDRKISGIYQAETVKKESVIIQGIGSRFEIPVSRYVTWADSEIEGATGLSTVARNSEAGSFLLESDTHPEWFMTGHGEYNLMTLHNEYHRDLSRGINQHIPDNYYPDNNPSAQPVDRWNTTARKMMANWIGVVKQQKSQQ